MTLTSVRFLPGILLVFLVGCVESTETEPVDPDPPVTPVTISVAGAGSVDEGILGGQAQFAISLSAASSAAITVNFEVRSGTATLGADFTDNSGSVSIPAGNVSGSVSVPVINDAIDEPNEAFTLVITSVSSGQVGVAVGTATIIDDDSPPTISIRDAMIAEGNAGTSNLVFDVDLSSISGFDVSVAFDTQNGSAIAPQDYTAIAGILNIPPGTATMAVSVAVNGDATVEADETFTVVLSNPANASIASGVATGTIANDDSVQGPPSVVSIGNAVGVVEGAASATLVYPVTLDTASSVDIVVQFQTQSGSATSGVDFVPQATSVTVPAGSLSASIGIAIIDDSTDEPDESLSVNLISVSSGSIGTASGTGTILDDDPLPAISVQPASVTEGNSGQANLAFSVSASNPSWQGITVNYATADGTATAGADYQATAGTATIPAGSTSTVVNVVVLGDTTTEADEGLSLVLSNPTNASVSVSSATGTIINDDGLPGLSVLDASTTEGDSGQSTIVFTIELDGVSSADVSFDYATSDGTALAGEDYQSATGTATITAGNTSTTVDVVVLADTTTESDEDFTLTLSNPTNATLLVSTASGVINNDDSVPGISVLDASVAEGDSGQSAMLFTVELDRLSAFDVGFDYATSDGSAAAGSDYVAVTGSTVIPAGSATLDISVLINGDADQESDETFSLSISNPSNGVLIDALATGAIVDDDSGLVSGLSSRPSNLTCLAPDRPTTSTAISTEAAFPSLPSFTDPVALLRAPGDDSAWYVVEKPGRVLRFTNSPSASAVTPFIDIREATDPINVKSFANEAGLLGMAFHPGYGASNWYVYLSYMIDGAAEGVAYTSVIARFESKDNGATLDATDHVELIRLAQPFDNHNGGNIAFGPDGYLYIGFGDGGSGGDPGDRSQNPSNLFGSMLRIDVDAGSPYAIPPDNPFAMNSLCNNGSGAAACPETYAWGLRNPWKWSFDSDTNQLWLADVGQDAWEEVDIIELGGNYGWRCREGAHNFNTSGTCPPGLIDPVIEYSSAVGDSITGGYVYRGTAIPELTGRYVFADYVRGVIFASVDAGGGTYDYQQLLDGPHFISAFAVEPNGELLYLNYGGGEVRRIIQGGGTSVDLVPTLLSATGCVDPTDPTVPASGLVPYDVNAPFWSDGASKERWYAIPDSQTIDVAADGDWLFPIGTVLVKNFRLNSALIETRLFMRHTDGEWAGYTYEWNDTQTEATRVNGGKVADKAGQSWIYPSGSECMQCHTASANFSLGLEHGQLNSDLTYPSTGITANQLYTADAVDLLTDPLPGTPDTLVSFAPTDDVSASLDARARAYLHSNCAGCHRPGGPTPSNMDLRHDTDFASTGTCNVVPVSGDLGISGATILTPSNPSLSLLIERPSRRDAHGMPPLGSTIVDSDGIQLLTDWVNSISACP